MSRFFKKPAALAGWQTLLGLLGTFAAMQPDAAAHNALWAAGAALAWAAGAAFWRRERREQRCFGPVGFLMAACTVLGLYLQSHSEAGWAGLAVSLLAGLGLGSATGEGLIRLLHLLEKPASAVQQTPRRAFWLVFAVLALCWTPVLLAHFPGITGYDVDGQAYQIYNQEYTTHHPLLHTLFMGACMTIGEWIFGSWSIGYGLHTIVQVLLLAASVAYAMRWLVQIRCPRWLWNGLLLFFALAPQHMMLASSGTKDVLFAAVMLVLAVEMVRLFSESQRAQRPMVWLGDLMLIVLAGLLRNNTIYAVLLVLVLGVLFFRRQLGRRVLALLLCGVVLIYGGEAALQKATNARDGSIREMLFIPFQQLGRVYALYGLDEPVGYEIREIMPYAEFYMPERADNTKRQAKVETPERLLRFVKLWGREALSFPQEYVDAFLLTTRGYWDINDVSFSTTYDDPENDVFRGSLIVWHNENAQIDDLGMLPGLRGLCYRLFALNECQNIPALWTIMHPALYTWLLLFILAAAICRQKWALLLPCGVLLAYLLTLLLGPCVLIRYSYYLMLACPVLLGCFYTNKEGLTHA